MNIDFRISVTLTDHHKIKRLIRVHGYESFYSLVKLWSYTAERFVNGRLTKMDDLDIALACSWNGDDYEAFVATLVDLRLLDLVDEEYQVHDWVENNPYAAGANERSDKARFSRMAKTHKTIYKHLKDQGYYKITSSEYQAVTGPDFNIENNNTNDVTTNVNASLTPSPSPSPSPSPNDKEYIVETKSLDVSPSVENFEKEKPEKTPYKGIVTYLNEKTGCDFKHTAKETQRCIKARWNAGFRFEDFKSVIDHKTDEWSTNEEFCQYLRPQTLFGTKFEGYLQAAKKNQHAGSAGIQRTPEQEKASDDHMKWLKEQGMVQ